jgi:V/A-type H+-transporting ATPase subunit G/H
LAIDALNQIREAEARARQQLDEARSQAQQATDQAARESESIIARARQSSVVESQKLLEEATGRAGEEIALMTAKATAEKSRVSELAGRNMEKAVSFIVERIVTARGRR